MKFNDKYLSIPPYISTNWKNVKALQMSGKSLLITLSDDSNVSVPDLDLEEIEQIFQAHADYLETVEYLEKGRTNAPSDVFKQFPSFGALPGQQMEFPFKVGLGSTVEGLGATLQHNPEHANAPDMPPEILSKVASIAKIVAPEHGDMEIPKPEPHCNCPHCQIARAINEGLGNPVKPFAGREKTGSDEIEEEVSDADLSFQQWNIDQAGDKLYVVSNKLDSDEKYHVYLGEPVGCTSGKEGCEHIVAVLHS
jgi:hypothetical protein